MAIKFRCPGVGLGRNGLGSNGVAGQKRPDAGLATRNPPLQGGLVLQPFKPLHAQGSDDITQMGDRVREQRKVFVGDRVAGRVAGLDIGTLQQFEPPPVDLAVSLGIERDSTGRCGIFNGMCRSSLC